MPQGPSAQRYRLKQSGQDRPTGQITPETEWQNIGPQSSTGFMPEFIPYGMGWRRDLPDVRDYTLRYDDVQDMLRDLEPISKKLPKRVDWRDYFGAVVDQAELGTSAAHACSGLVQYFDRRARGRIFEPAAMFIYCTTRRLLNQNGDSGADLRTTWKAIVRFGIPPEQSWPYNTSKLDEEPDAFAYSCGRDHDSLCFVRLDERGQRGKDTLKTVKSFLAAGFPSVFGFSVCTSVSIEPEIPFPNQFGSVRGGQAVVAVGYSDDVRVGSDKGALLIRNSWGINWGDRGYGWLPYRYVEEELAADFWTILNPDWLASGEFEQPS